MFKKKKFVKKSGLVMTLLAMLMLAGCVSTAPEAGSAETEAPEEEVVEIVYTAYDVAQLDKDLEGNALKAAQKYKDQYVELTGKLDVIDSSGSYISITDPGNPFDFLGVQCSVQNEEQKEAIMNLAVGDILVVKGQITDVGEIIGYALDIDSVVKK